MIYYFYGSPTRVYTESGIRYELARREKVRARAQYDRIMMELRGGY